MRDRNIVRDNEFSDSEDEDGDRRDIRSYRYASRDELSQSAARGASKRKEGVNGVGNMDELEGTTVSMVLDENGRAVVCSMPSDKLGLERDTGFGTASTATPVTATDFTRKENIETQAQNINNAESAARAAAAALEAKNNEDVEMEIEEMEAGEIVDEQSKPSDMVMMDAEVKTASTITPGPVGEGSSTTLVTSTEASQGVNKQEYVDAMDVDQATETKPIITPDTLETREAGEIVDVPQVTTKSEPQSYYTSDIAAPSTMATSAAVTAASMMDIKPTTQPTSATTSTSHVDTDIGKAEVVKEEESEIEEGEAREEGEAI
jgi:hypothetical protein